MSTPKMRALSRTTWRYRDRSTCKPECPSAILYGSIARWVTGLERTSGESLSRLCDRRAMTGCFQSSMKSTEWVEADFSGWYQKALNDGQTRAGAFDIYVMDDLWVPRFAGAGYLANLQEMGFQTDEDFVPNALALGYWPPKAGLRQPGIDPKAISMLYSLPLISDVQLLFYRNDIYRDGSPTTWDNILKVAREQANPARRQYGWVTRGVKGNPV